MSSEIDVTLSPVIRVLEELQVRFYICGSVASSVHGEMRATADIDIVAELRAEQAKTLAQKLGDAYYVDEIVIREAIERRSSFNIIHQGTFIKVDIFAPKDRKYDQEALRRVVTEKLGITDDAIEAPVSQPEDIVLAKLEWYRIGGETSDRQWRDILGVLKMQCFDIDIEYMQKWAVEIGVEDLLERALDESGLIEQSEQ